MDGKLPEGWEWKKLGDICEINPSVPFPSDFSPETKISFVPMACVDDLNGEIISAEHRPIGEIWNGYKRFADGDVLFARITPCMENGKAAIATGLLNRLGTGSTEFHVLRPKKVVLAKWIHYFVRRDGFLKEAAEGMTGTAGQQRLPKAFLENSKIPLPSLETQRRNVVVLDKAEETRRLRAQADELATELPLSVFHHMFGDPRKKKKWEMVTPQDIASSERNAITIGPFGSDLMVKDYRHNGVPLVFVKNIRENSFQGKDTRYIDHSKAEKLRSHQVKSGDILMTKMGDPAGDVAVYPDFMPAIITADCIKFTLDPEAANNIYVLWAMKTDYVKDQIIKNTKGAAQQKINLNIFKSIKFPLPPTELQNDFAVKIGQVERIRVLGRRSSSEMEQLFSTLIQKSFIGELIA